MATNYPTALDDGTTLPNNRTTATPLAGAHVADHNNLADAVRAIEGAIGTAPAGAYPTLRDRVAAGQLPVAADLTLSGPPTAGAHLAGETYVDGLGCLWVCMQGGTPGAWTCGSPGSLIDHVDMDQFVWSTAVTVPTALETPLVVAPYSTGLHPVWVECQAQLTNSAAVAGVSSALSICDVTGFIAPAANNEVLRLVNIANLAGGQFIQGRRKVTLPAGIRVLKAFLWTASATNVASITAGSTLNPAVLASLSVRWA